MAFIWRRVHAEDEPVLPREDLQQPRATLWKAHRCRWYRAGVPGQDAHEADDVGSYGLIREMTLRHQPENVPSVADHNLGIKGKPAGQCSAQSRLRHWPPDHKGTRGADVDDIELCQFLGEHGGSEGSVTADVDAPQKNHECHAPYPKIFGVGIRERIRSSSSTVTRSRPPFLQDSSTALTTMPRTNAGIFFMRSAAASSHAIVVGDSAP